MTFATITNIPIKRPGRYVQVAVPLPKGQFFWQDGLTDFTVISNAVRLVTQCERVSRYSDGSMAVAFLLADANQNAKPTSVSVENVVRRENEREFQYHPRILEDLRDFLQLDESRQPVWSGPVAMQRRIKTLHSVGWATFFTGSPCVRIDLLEHNALPADKEELGIPDFPFTDIPKGWTITWTIAEPLGEIGLEEPHFWPQRAMRIMRFVLHPMNDLPDDVVIGAGFGVARSAWRTTSAYGPTLMPAPDLSHINGKIVAQQTSDWITIRNALENGTKYPSSASNGRLGIFHPAGNTQAGVTGGSGITDFPGCDLIETGSIDGLYQALYEQRMDLDRHRIGMIRPDNGDSYTYEDKASEFQNGGIRMASDNSTFDKQGSRTLDGSFNWSSQVPLPSSAAPEIAPLRTYMPYDLAHRIRILGEHVKLTWLLNDSLSRYLLRMEAEVARMSLLSDTRLHRNLNFVVSNQHRGIGWDRNQGWASYAIAGFYQVATDANRARIKSTMNDLLSCCMTGVMENGCLSCLTSGKQAQTLPYAPVVIPNIDPAKATYGAPEYGVTVAIQHGLLGGGMVALARTLGLDARFGFEKGVEFLRQGQGTIWSAATRPINLATTPYKSRQVKPDGTPIDSTAPGFYSGKPDSEQTRALLGFALIEAVERGGDVASVMNIVYGMLGATPRAAMRAMGMGVIDSDASLLCALDKVGSP